MAELTQEQTEKLLQFQDLSGIENIDQCKDILHRHNWNIEVAVQSHFGHDHSQSFQTPESPQLRTPPVEQETEHQDVLSVRIPRQISWIDWGYMVLSFPFRFVYSTVFDLLRFTYRLLRPPEIEHTDPEEEIRRFLERYDERYGVDHPPFLQGTYGQALNKAKQDLRFLLVCLHGDDHQDSEIFCRNTLREPSVVEFLQNGNFYTWVCNVNCSEGYKVSRVMRETSYPFLAVIVLKRTKMTVVARIEGPVDSNTLVTRLTRMVLLHQPQLDLIRAERDERAFNQTLRDQQDRAYLESLRVDQEKERKKKEVEEEKKQQEKAKLDEVEAEERKKEELVRRKDVLRNLIPGEPDSDDVDAVRLVLKLPSGVRLERRFNKHQSLKYLYYFVFVHESCPDDFQIITNFPRRILPCDPANDEEPPSFEEVGLEKNQLLFVQDNEA